MTIYYALVRTYIKKTCHLYEHNIEEQLVW